MIDMLNRRVLKLLVSLARCCGLYEILLFPRQVPTYAKVLLHRSLPSWDKNSGNIQVSTVSFTASHSTLSIRLP